MNLPPHSGHTPKVPGIRPISDSQSGDQPSVFSPFRTGTDYPSSGTPQSSSRNQPMPGFQSSAATVEFNLKSLLHEVPLAKLGFNPEQIPANVNTELPVDLLQGQVGSGLVEVSLQDIINGCLERYRPAFANADMSQYVVLPLDEVEAQLPPSEPALSPVEDDDSEPYTSTEDSASRGAAFPAAPTAGAADDDVASPSTDTLSPFAPAKGVSPFAPASGQQVPPGPSGGSPFSPSPFATTIAAHSGSPFSPVEPVAAETSDEQDTGLDDETTSPFSPIAESVSAAPGDSLQDEGPSNEPSPSPFSAGTGAREEDDAEVPATSSPFAPISPPDWSTSGAASPFSPAGGKPDWSVSKSDWSVKEKTDSEGTLSPIDSPLAVPETGTEEETIGVVAPDVDSGEDNAAGTQPAAQLESTDDADSGGASVSSSTAGQGADSDEVEPVSAPSRGHAAGSSRTAELSGRGFAAGRKSGLPGSADTPTRGSWEPSAVKTQSAHAYEREDDATAPPSKATAEESVAATVPSPPPSWPSLPPRAPQPSGPTPAAAKDEKTQGDTGADSDSAKDRRDSATAAPKHPAFDFSFQSGPNQLALRALFETSEPLEIDEVLNRTTRLRGLHACTAIVKKTGEAKVGSAATGERATRFAAQAKAAYKKVIGLAEDLEVKDAETFTLKTSAGAMSFFNAPHVCLTVLHDDFEFAAGVKEKLILISRDLSSMLATSP